MTDINKVMGKTNESVLTVEEGLELTRQSVWYFYNMPQFSNLKKHRDLEDLVQEISLRFIENGVFESYDVNKSTKSYMVSFCVRNAMINISSKKRIDTISLEMPTTDDETCVVGDLVSDDKQDVMGDYITEEDTLELLNKLPDDTKTHFVGNSPVIGEMRLSHRTIAFHIALGYSRDEIAQMFRHEVTGESPKTVYITKKIHEMRDILSEYND